MAGEVCLFLSASCCRAVRPRGATKGAISARAYGLNAGVLPDPGITRELNLNYNAGS